MIETPDFRGIRLIDRLNWAKDNLEKVYSDYRVVYEDDIDECAKVLSPSPNFMACALQGGILPPVWVYWELAKDEAQPDFKRHTRKYLVHNSEPMPPMSEEQAIEYLIMKELPQDVWRTWNEGNKPKLIICTQQQLPQTREWRDAWVIPNELAAAA